MYKQGQPGGTSPEGSIDIYMGPAKALSAAKLQGRRGFANSAPLVPEKLAGRSSTQFTV